MAVNKVIYGNQTVLDISDSTVTPETLGKDETAYDKSGKKITGTMEAGGGGGTVDTCTVVVKWLRSAEALMYYFCILASDDSELTLATSYRSDFWDTNPFPAWDDGNVSTVFPQTLTNVACGTTLLLESGATLVIPSIEISGGGRLVYNDQRRFQFTTPYTAGATMTISIADLD